MKQHKDGTKRIVSPLNSSFMLTSIIGFLVSALYIPSMADKFPNAAPSFAFAFSIVFVCMFIASMISMTYSPVEDGLHIDEKRRIRL